MITPGKLPEKDSKGKGICERGSPDKTRKKAAPEKSPGGRTRLTREILDTIIEKSGGDIEKFINLLKPYFNQNEKSQFTRRIVTLNKVTVTGHLR